MGGNWAEAVVIIRVHQEREADLAHIGGATGLPCPRFGRVQRWQKKASQYRNDRYDDQELD
jgi:hypothetical protein